MVLFDGNVYLEVEGSGSYRLSVDVWPSGHACLFCLRPPDRHRLRAMLEYY